MARGSVIASGVDAGACSELTGGGSLPMRVLSNRARQDDDLPVGWCEYLGDGLDRSKTVTVVDDPIFTRAG
ncbi:hypothetical protein C8034_v000911 [Colletotrichum sidae]|uniref:Uncharacterized protein n=2 Tax=Colletotrichum orbiculare species complex TaxID=2707354 RepID=A0A4R8PNF9_9PEZI|nr:hypothetical protein C8035_v004358 [Colletotrichum spinosum]TEA16784.1 hypothetical protein C8034_v000911 [Colletotrichum sidae]